MSDHEFRPVVDRLRDIARQATAGGVIETAPHPDVALLELCAKVLDLHAEHDAVDREARKMEAPYMGNPAFEAEMKKRDALQSAWRNPLARIGKVPAKTAAGIFAKAMVLRMVTAAPALAQSLADDLVECPGLRASLWPAEAQS